MTESTALLLDIEQYGKYARGSALADYLELAALQGRVITRSHLEAVIKQNDWFRLNRGMFTKDPDIDPVNVESLELLDGTEDLDDPDWPDWTFTILRQRSDVLGVNYPFEVSQDDLRFCGSKPDTSDYCRLLALTMAHAYGAKVKEDPREIFELLLVVSLSNLGFLAHGMGTAVTRGKAFVAALAEAAAALGLTPSAAPWPRKAFAKDAGVDAIGVLNWNDRRPGQIIVTAQATIAQSARWEYKIGEPKGNHWAGYLNEVFNPVAILAVPHHIEDEHFRYLLGPASTILDRLRLVGKLGPMLAGEIAIREWLLSRDLVL